MRWRRRSIVVAVTLGVAAAIAPAGPAAAQRVDAPTVTGASPLTGPPGGGNVVTMTGSGFQPGVTQVLVVGTGLSFQRPIPASAMTIDSTGTTMSFAMPPGPPGGGPAGLVAFAPGRQAEFVPTYSYPELAVTGASPSSGPSWGDVVVTMTGSGFQPGVTAVMLVLQGGGWQHELPASAMTIDAEGTTMSFTMPQGPPSGGLVGMVAFVPGIQGRIVPSFTYSPATAPRQRVADDSTTLPSTGGETGALLAVAAAAVALGVGLRAAARRPS